MNGLRVTQLICTNAFAGAERYVRNSAVWLSGRGCRVTVVGGEEAAMRPALEAAGVAWLPGATAAQAMSSLRRAGRADVINTHMTIADTVGSVAGRVMRVPVVSTRHFAATRGSSGPARVVGRGIRRAVSAQLAISEFVAASVEGESTTVLSGVEPVEAVDRSRLPIVLVAQRLEVEKQTQLALEAWARVRRSGYHGWRLVLAGDGAQRAELQRRAAELGIADIVDFLGRRSDMAELYDSASLLLATAPAEPFGLSVLEAMSHGLPVVAAAGGGHLETVGGAPGAALFPPGDAVAAAEQLCRLMVDPRERHRYGEALRARQRERFTAAAQTDGTLRVFESVVGAR